MISLPCIPPYTSVARILVVNYQIVVSHLSLNLKISWLTKFCFTDCWSVYIIIHHELSVQKKIWRQGIIRNRWTKKVFKECVSRRSLICILEMRYQLKRKKTWGLRQFSYFLSYLFLHIPLYTVIASPILFLFNYLWSLCAICIKNELKLRQIDIRIIPPRKNSYDLLNIVYSYFTSNCALYFAQAFSSKHW